CLAQVRGVEDEPPVPSATTHRLVGFADGDIAPRSNVGEDDANGVSRAGISNGPASDQAAVVAACLGFAGRNVGEVEPAQVEGGHRLAHGMIFSMGTTRIPEAPAALSRGSRPQTSSELTTEWTAIMPVWASGMIVGDSRAGSSRSISSR
ncbi:MAG: hypothetical protein QOI37_1792, partial [Chloroflexota bacterium]|nr:hypothetical protein [Chloroflexota bacterium]